MEMDEKKDAQHTPVPRELVRLKTILNRVVKRVLLPLHLVPVSPLSRVRVLIHYILSDRVYRKQRLDCGQRFCFDRVRVRHLDLGHVVEYTLQVAEIV